MELHLVGIAVLLAFALASGPVCMYVCLSIDQKHQPPSPFLHSSSNRKEERECKP